MNPGLIVSSLFTAALLAAATAQAAELKVIGATPMAGVLKDLGGQFERETGHRLVTKFVSGPIVKQQIDAGEPFDVAVSITPVINDLVQQGRILEATRVDVSFAGIGVGVRAGAAKPDISTVDAFKRALLSANSVAHSATGASGDHFKRMMDRLGIADEMKPKLRPMPADTIAQAVSSGAAEMIVVTKSVIMVPGTDFAGPVPSELQFYNSFAAGVGASAKEQEAAHAFVRALTGPAAAAVLAAHGMEPGIPR